MYVYIYICIYVYIYICVYIYACTRGFIVGSCIPGFALSGHSSGTISLSSPLRQLSYMPEEDASSFATSVLFFAANSSFFPPKDETFCSSFWSVCAAASVLACNAFFFAANEFA